MALLHRDHTDSTDTVAGPPAAEMPAWPQTTPGAVHEERIVKRNSFGQTLRTVLATVLLVAIVAVAIANTEEVDIDLLFGTVDPPLAALVGGAAGAGFLIGLLLAHGRHKRR